ncbi:MAG TPA: HAMP domain-containing sensor histidine kinase [Ktedonobacteraceae bacterium]|nr:HAMP domain-containing sensor histidine kinase [Ktedonobacteraceae bacterium]
MKCLFHKLWPPGIRVQVVCWYTAVFTLVLLLAGAAFYYYVENALESSVDASLQIQAQQIAEELVAGHDTLTIHDATGVLSGLSSNQPVDAPPIVQGTLVRLLDVQGRVLRETPASRTLQIPPQSITQALQGLPWKGTIRTTAGQEVQLYCRALTVQGKVIALLQVGQSLATSHALLRQLVSLLLLVGTLALLVCAASSFLLTRRAFTPVQQLMQAARRIKAGDLQQRVPLPPAHDEIRTLAVTLNEMLDSLDQMVTRQRRFVADASHELRTPVAVIRNKTSIALLKPQKRQEYITVLQDINAEAGRLGHLISDLLALARGDEGHAPFERELVRLDLVAEATAASMQALAEERNIQLTVHAVQPVTLVGDEARLIQVVINILENALRYTHPGGQVSLTVQTMQDKVQLVVRDTGIGIAPEHLPHLFERFYRVDPARMSTEGGNHGLGLSIVAWIVRVHGGTIAVASQPGQGSCFTVTLPLTPPSPAQGEMGE